MVRETQDVQQRLPGMASLECAGKRKGPITASEWTDEAKQFQDGREKVSCPGLDLDQTHIKDRSRGSRREGRKKTSFQEV